MEKEIIAALIGAVSALVVVMMTGSFSARQSRSSRAHELFDEYLERCRSNPTYASFNAFASRNPGTFSFNPYVFENDAVETYHWTVSQMLYAVEEIIRIKSNSYWRNTVLDQIRFHKDYFDLAWDVKLAGSSRSMKDGFSKVVQELVAEVRRP